MSLRKHDRVYTYINLDRSDNEESLKMPLEIIERHEYEMNETVGSINW